MTPHSGAADELAASPATSVAGARDGDGPDELEREVRFLRSQLDQLAGGQLKADSQLSRLRYELRQRKQGNELLSRLFASLDVTAEIPVIYAKVCQQTCATLKTDRAVLLVPAGEPRAFRPAHWSGYPARDAARIAQRSISVPETFDQRQATVLVTRESPRGPFEEALCAELEIPFLIAVPIMDGSGLASVLVVGRNKEVKPFSPPFDAGDVNSLQVISGFVAAAIQNVALYQLEKRERFVRDTFGRYLSDNIVAQLLGDPAGLNLGGESRTLSIVMSDLRGFTQLSETLAPAQVVSLLNNYLGEMTEVIQRHQGTIDEFIGDAIMIIFGAPVRQPDHADRAVACALEMQLAMSGVNAWNRAQGLPVVEMGIGINTGEAIVGNIGSNKRAKYGAVGRTVNLASRVESYSHGRQVLVSEPTRKAVRASLRIDAEFQVRAKGVQGLLTLYETGAIGEPFCVALPMAAHSPTALRASIGVRYAPLDGKHVSTSWIEGRIVGLSEREAEIIGAQAVAPLTNLLLRLACGPAREIDFYAKSLAITGADANRFIVHFSSVSEAARAALDAAARALADGPASQ